MSRSWQWATLGEVCDLATGGTPSTHNKSFYENGEIKWLRSGDVHKRDIHDCEGRITAAGMASANTKFLPLNSVLIALAGQGKTRGTVAMLRTQATCNQSVVSIMPIDEQSLLPEFVYWYLRSKYHEIRRLTGDDGNDRRGLNMRIIRGLNVPVPSVTEQQRIVAKLDELSEIHAELASCYASAFEQTKAVWISALNRELEPKDWWTPVTLADVATFHNGRAYKKEELLASGKYRVLRVGNFFSSDSWYWSDLELDPTKYCVHGDLLYAWSASFGPRIWDGEKTIYHYHIWKVVEDSSLIGRMFLKFWLEADVERVKAASGTGTTMMHVSKGSIEAREIRVPPLSLQRAIVEKLEEVQKRLSLLVDVHSKRLEAAQNLRRSVLAAAFRGDL